MRKPITGTALTALITVPPGIFAAHAHPGHDLMDVPHDPGFFTGFLHPLGGIDHLLAMVTVGILAWQLGGRALWLVPGTFLAAMAAGGAVGIMGITLPASEAWIVASVVGLGALVALGWKAPVAAAMAVTGLFGLFHGYAHGVEMPADMSAFGYAAGFLAATALLHGLGLGIGFAAARLGRNHDQIGYRLSGGAVSLAGLMLAVGWL